MKKYIFAGLALILVILIATNWSLVKYGWSQAVGQIQMVQQARPIIDVLAEGNLPPELARQLRHVEDIKRFAIDSLGLKGEDAYTQYYDHQGRKLMTVLIGSPPFELKPYEWSFPIAGSFSYKGFFKEKMATTAEQELKQKGYETMLYSPKAWSTLGWFDDPVTTAMITFKEPDSLLAEIELARTIIHELAHRTIFVKSNTDLNENIATLIGDYGAARYAAMKHGQNSYVYRNYIINREDYQKFSQHLVLGAKQLNQLYKEMEQQNMPLPRRDYQKKQFIQKIIQSLDTVSFHKKELYLNHFYETNFPNNTYFISYLQYRSYQKELEQELKNQYNSDLTQFVEAKEKTYSNQLYF